MDELRDSLVSGRFSGVSALVRGEAAGGPEGLEKEKEREDAVRVKTVSEGGVGGG